MSSPPSANDPERVASGLFRDVDCRMCRLCEGAKTVCILGTGDNKADGMIVGEAPGASEDDGGKPFVGRAGQLLHEALKEVGLDPDDLYITNAVHCRPPENRTPTKAEWRKCKPWLDYELSKVKPKVVLLVGNVALESVLGLKGIKKLRGQPIEKGGVIYLPTWHPAYILRDDRARPQLISDLRKFAAMIESGGMPNVPELDHIIVETTADRLEMMKYLRSTRRLVFDLETTGLSPWHSEITSINLGDDKRQFCIPVSAEAWAVPWEEEDVLEMLVEIDRMGHRKCNQNAKFDSLFLWLHFDIKWLVDFDTMLAHYMLNENALHGLEVLAAERFGALDWDIPLEVKQGKKGRLEDHARYACLDIAYTYRLWEEFEDELEQQPAVHKVFEKLLMPAARMFVDIEFHGVTIDKERFDAMEVELRREIGIQELALNKLVPGVNWGSTKQVAQVLFDRLGLEPLDKTKKGAPSTSESVLKRLAVEHPVPALLMKRRAAKQQLSFFIEGWKPWLRRQGNRWVLHPSFKLHGTVTGRLSCENPNLQQVPRDPKIRQMITAKPGWVLIEADLSQIELRILAELSGDPEMMRCFQTNVDIHWLTALREIFRGGGYKKEVIETACRISGKNNLDYDDCLEILLEAGPDAAIDHGPPPSDAFKGWKEIRKLAKAINFGYAYGMWWKKFIIYARDNYDVIVNEEQAQESRKSYFDLYKKLPSYHKRQREFANRNGYVRSLIGRRRRLPRAMDREDSFERQESERQAINSPIQSFASDLNLMAALELRERWGPDVIQVVGTVHDALLIEVRVDKLRQVVKDVLRIMQHPPLMDEFDVELRVPLEAEVKVGPWGVGKSLERHLAA